MKAKITEYKGTHFRSRLEVKWCKFFEYLGVTFEYEPKLEKTRLGGYVPDFYFKSLRTWIEIKGTNPTDEELTKIKGERESVFQKKDKRRMQKYR